MMSGYGCDDLAYSAVIPPYFANGACVITYTIYALLFHNFSSKLAKTVRAQAIATNANISKESKVIYNCQSHQLIKIKMVMQVG